MAFIQKTRPYFFISLFISFLLSTFLSAGQSIALVPDSTAHHGLTLTEGVQKTVLDNGLTVLTKEIHTAPVVSIQVWYRVGSRNEAPGINGISHQLEHLMFKGTVDRPIQFGRLFNALGSQSNAFTSYDETAYFGTVQREKLNALLTLEADRMQNSVISEDHLASEKRVVISELQGYENNPGYRLGRAVMRSAFSDHPYGLPVGGTKADVEKFTVQQVQEYYKKYYSPDNATLVITGDFDTPAALETVKQTFGKLPKSTASHAVNPGSASLAETQTVATRESPRNRQSIVLREPGSATLLQLIYPLPQITHVDVPAIDLMDMILTGGRSSQLYQALVESGLASSVGAYPAELIDRGWYSVAVTVAPGKTLADVENTLNRALTAIRNQPVGPEELERAKTQLRTSFVLSNQDITSQASQLGYNQTVTGDYQYSDRYLAAIDQVTVADIQRVAKLYLDPTQQTRGSFEPTQPNGQADVPSAVNSGRTAENFSPGAPVDPVEVARYLPTIPTSTRTTPQSLPEVVTLENGLRVLLLRDTSTPAINLSGHISAGSAFDSIAQAGLANLTSDSLLNGTQAQNALGLARSLEDRGVELSFSTNREGVVVDGVALAPELPYLINTLADVLQNATFPKDQLALTRQRHLSRLKAQLDDPSYLSRRVFQQTIYPEHHPFHAFPSEASLQQITQADVVQFYKTHYRPDTTVLTLVGDFEPTQARSLLTNAFQNWQPNGSKPTLNFPAVNLPQASHRLTKVIPGKAEAVTYLGYSGISRRDPRYYSALVLNQILGGDTLSSRLGSEVRDRQGLTYGIYSFFQAGIYPGPFLILMQTSPEDANRAIDSTIALLRQLQQKGITAAELDTAKRSLTNSYPVELANPSSLASTMTDNATYGLTREEIRQFPQKIEAVTLDQIQQVIQELIHPDNLVIVTAGPSAIARADEGS